MEQPFIPGPDRAGDRRVCIQGGLPMSFIMETGIGTNIPDLRKVNLTKPDIFGYQVYRALKLISFNPESGGGAIITDGLGSLRNNPYYDIEIDGAGIPGLPRYRILSVTRRAYRYY
jgi:hypothetical protein